MNYYNKRKIFNGQQTWLVKFASLLTQTKEQLTKLTNFASLQRVYIPSISFIMDYKCS